MSLDNVISRWDHAVGTVADSPYSYMARSGVGMWVRLSDVEAIFDSQDWKVVPTDLLTHLGDWENACKIARDNAPPPREDEDDRGYWQHQLDTIDKIKRALGQ